MSSDPRIGTVVAGHRIVSVIGRGGMSIVYLAEHLGLERSVALKILGPELAEDEAFRERFIRESRVAAELDHPNVVTVYDAGEADGLLYLSMRYVEGSDLERLLRSVGALDPSTTADLIAQCAAGLDAAHAHGLVHRDVKPGNVLLGPRGDSYHAYLSDFGVTKRIHTGASLTRSGQFVGTVDYVAPEQIRSDDVDARADVYSLACVAFRCLTGDVPFPRDTEVATIYAQLQDPPPRPSERRPEVPAGFDAPILRALAKEREARFASCGEFADAVAGVVSPSPPFVARPSKRAAGPGPRPGRGRVLAGAAATLAVVVAAVLLWPGSRGGTAESPSPPATLPELSWDGSSLPTGGARGAAAAAVEVGGSPIVAGWVTRDGDRDAAVWTTTADGAWRLEPSRGFGGPADQRIAAIATNGSVIVAVGSESAREDVDAAVWRSVDGGASWTRVDPVTAGLHRIADQAMLAVVHGSAGWIAAGWDRSGGGADAAVWLSDDGTEWIRHGADALGGIGRQAIAALATVGERTVAAGWTTGPDGDLDGAVWLQSAGGWSRVPGDAFGGPGDQVLWAAAADGARIVVGGDGTTATGAPRPAVWTSDDGEAWVPATGSGLAGAGSVRSVIRIDGAWVAGGSIGTDADRAPAVWRSADGATWPAEPEAPAPSLGPSDGTAGTIGALVGPGPGRLVAAGTLLAVSPVAWLADVS